MGRTDRIVVGGARNVDLDALIKDLRAVDKDLPKRIQQAHKEVASFVADDAKSRIGRLPGAAGGTIRKKAAEGVRPRAKQKSAAIALLGSKGGFAQTFEFGTRWHPIPIRLRRGQYMVRRIPAASMARRVFPPWVGNQFHGGEWKDGLHGREGHYVAPAIQNFINNGEFVETYAQFIDRSFRKLAD